MKNRKVLNLRTHLGGWLGKTSYDSEQDKCEMEVCAVGVLIKKIKGAPILFKGKPVHIISMTSNNIEALVEPEEAVEIEAEKPRGPGRPPGIKIA